MNSRLSALDIAARVQARTTCAADVIEDALQRIAQENTRLGAFTDITAERARARAADLDRRRDQGQPLPPLAGVPFAVKNLFDIAGLPTGAGSKINRTETPALQDATAIERLEAAGAILVGACTMDEYAYGFTGENVHEGASRNPHDVTRMSGGSSGGPAAAVAGGLVPFSLGSDTNGSIRVPASLTGIYGLKPTYGRLSRAGAFPFVASLDHIGVLAGTLDDVAAVYDVLQGADPRDSVCTPPGFEPVHPALGVGSSHLRVALADGYFREGASGEVLEAVDAAAAALKVSRHVSLPEAHRARAAAYLITAAEGGALHRARLIERAADFDPDTRDRLTAGALLPAHWLDAAQRFRRWFHREALEVFKHVDVILAPATPITAPKLGQRTFLLDRVELPVRASLGLYTQPLSLIGLPVVAVPLKRPEGALPVGLQVIGAPWNERAVFQVARALERAGATAAQ